jgi:hypothetical protein
MLNRSLVIAVVAAAVGAAPLAGTRAKSNDHGSGNHANGKASSASGHTASRKGSKSGTKTKKGETKDYLVIKLFE